MTPNKANTPHLAPPPRRGRSLTLQSFSDGAVRVGVISSYFCVCISYH